MHACSNSPQITNEKASPTPLADDRHRHLQPPLPPHLRHQREPQQHHGAGRHLRVSLLCNPTLEKKNQLSFTRCEVTWPWVCGSTAQVRAADEQGRGHGARSDPGAPAGEVQAVGLQPHQHAALWPALPHRRAPDAQRRQTLQHAASAPLVRLPLSEQLPLSSFLSLFFFLPFQHVPPAQRFSTFFEPRHIFYTEEIPWHTVVLL